MDAAVEVVAVLAAGGEAVVAVQIQAVRAGGGGRDEERDQRRRGAPSTPQAEQPERADQQPP